MGTITQKELASQASTPSTGYWRLYPKADGFYIVDDLGVESKIAVDGGNLHVFGLNFKVTENYTVTQYSTTTYQTYLTLVTDNLVLGDYRVGYNYVWSYNDVSGNYGIFDLYVNGVAHLPSPVQWETRNTTDRPQSSGFVYLENVSGVKTITLQCKCQNNNDTLTVRSAYLEFWRVK